MEEARQQLADLKLDMERHKGNAEYTARLEVDLKAARRELAEAKRLLQYAHSSNYSTPEGFHQSWLDDPFLPAGERHRLQSNPRPATVDGAGPGVQQNLGGPGGYPDLSPLHRDSFRGFPGTERPRAAVPVTPHWSTRLNPLNYLRTPFNPSNGDGVEEGIRPPGVGLRGGLEGLGDSGEDEVGTGERGVRGSRERDGSGSRVRSCHRRSARGDRNNDARGRVQSRGRSKSNTVRRESHSRRRGRRTSRDASVHHSEHRFREEYMENRRRPGSNANYQERNHFRANDAFNPGMSSGAPMRPFGNGLPPPYGNSFPRTASVRLKPEDITFFEGKNVDFFLASCRSYAALYSDRSVLEVIPRALKGVAKDWFLSIPPSKRHYLDSLEGWAFLLRDEFGEDDRRQREKAEARFFDPAKEDVETYYWEKKQMHERAEPGISEFALMRELWKGLGRKTPWLQVLSYHQHSLRDFKEELLQRVERQEKRSEWKRSQEKPSTEKRESKWRSEVKVKPEKKGNTSAEKKSQKPSDRGLPGCKNCGEDHFHSACPKKTKTYHVKEAAEVSSDEEDQEDEERSESGNSVSTIKSYNVASRNEFSFAQTRRISSVSKVKVTELPRSKGVGTGVSFLNGSPLPLEAWLVDPSDETPTIMGCGDSGGQCLIALECVPKQYLKAISRHASMNPSFQGVGGASEKGLGFVVIAVFLPDEKTLNGDPSGKIVKVWVEFQIVKSLDCNFLLGRDATRAYGIDFVESKGVIVIGGIEIPMADKKHLKSVRKTINSMVTVGKDVCVPPHCDVLVEICMPVGIPTTKVLLFKPVGFVDLPRQLHGRIPVTLMFSNCSVVNFSNLCDYPMKLGKGERLGHVDVVQMES